MIEQVISSLTQTRQKIKEINGRLKQLRSYEKELLQEVKTFMNESGDDQVMLEDGTVITLSRCEKKILFNKKDYENNVREMLYSRGIDDDDFFKDLLNKTKDVVDEQRVKLKK
ncbi:029L [Cherax quadricarinatus iridovirus]|uniref:Uncharacterized protein n=1 Tax=Shrimp hemocyte iridescent virus TaxID=2039780 RepID=A0A291B0X2_9VIRU|nr:029L [Cherax quadricarinatus iridovirus]YP_010084873.1 hypothetical protein KM509_gp121 [Shrimp hemocyte iridescent virus]UPA43349.1 hypothetical protein 4TH000075 [Iridovirus CN01]ASZ85009.1 029L [Cherax quadricarinatus iridovirus]ATE87130.1 hypothetical protein [Shrimp hemocyte iridescent virus]UPA43584.1 hypothetical protein 3TG000151 [Iridovirus CN01]UPA43619.1 hypothetical protein 1DG000027 [Iridovirus CN01]